MRPKEDTIVAIATPHGEGGLAVLRVSGPLAFTVANLCFRPIKKQATATEHFRGYSVHYGHFVDPDTHTSLDDGLLTVFRTPHSYTGEDTLEISCHGGRANTLRLLEAVLRAGARMAEPGEFTQRAFLNGKLDLAQAEAVADIIRAQTEASCRMAQSQLAGALSQEVNRLKEELIGILAAIEVTIDFSDEVGELEYAPLLIRIQKVQARLHELHTTSGKGRILREGLRLAIVGRPNVGKSSLLNALLRSDRAIVTPIPGTTRDMLEETTHIGGVPVVLMDTAGIRATEDMIEQRGVERTKRAAETADMVLIVFDMTTFEPDNFASLLNEIPPVKTLQTLVIGNKIDIANRAQSEALRSSLPENVPSPVFVSAQTGEGLEALEAVILERAFGTPTLAFDSVVVSHARHKEALELAMESLKEAERTTLLALPGDFIAIDVRGALDALGLITGETVTEAIVERIFHDFCVGK